MKWFRQKIKELKTPGNRQQGKIVCFDETEFSRDNCPILETNKDQWPEQAKDVLVEFVKVALKNDLKGYNRANLYFLGFNWKFGVKYLNLLAKLTDIEIVFPKRDISKYREWKGYVLSLLEKDPSRAVYLAVTSLAIGFYANDELKEVRYKFIQREKEEADGKKVTVIIQQELNRGNPASPYNLTTEMTISGFSE
ncbi:hypothetical protein J4216_05295 [Candidatus Woesearchaeota archaeon]|nr:hypothetical protein [Candidatus Woesearchaeota archaeon]